MACAWMLIASTVQVQYRQRHNTQRRDDHGCNQFMQLEQPMGAGTLRPHVVKMYHLSREPYSPDKRSYGT
eukprot:3985572-Amphidinium_carterae.1